MNHSRGQGLLEVILALAIFALLASALTSMLLGSFDALVYGGDYGRAEFLAQAGLEAARGVREGAWNELINNSIDIVGPFTRTRTLAPVCRTALHDIATCPAAYDDLESKQLEVKIGWTAPSGAAAEVGRLTYLTNWDSRDWEQTDWSGGAGQGVWSDSTRYFSDDGNIDFSTVGEIKLRALPASWGLQADTGAQTWNDIYMLSGEDGFVVTSGGVIWRLTTDVWSLARDTGNEIWNDIICLSTSNCWAVGNSGATVHYTGASWNELVVPSPANMMAVYAVSSTDIWAAGASGRLWHYNGSAWSLSIDTGGETWNDIACSSTNDCWAVGNSGALAHYTGSWSEATVPSVANINSVFAVSVNDVWAAGASGRLWHYNGSVWELYTTTGGQTWNDLHLTSASDGFVVGSGGNIRRWSGSAWNNVTPTGTSQNLLGVYCVSAADCWAAGGSGQIVRFVSGGYVGAGSLQSSSFSLGNPSPVQVIDWDQTIPACSPACTARFQLRTSTDGSSWTPWSGAGGSGTYFTNAIGTLVDQALNGGQWVEYRLELAGDGLTTPAVQAVRVNYK
ncbi:MAG: prepilin-type N-terminal cleavage/methylation domain-containing protein [Patescibacteria group bacterium]